MARLPPEPSTGLPAAWSGVAQPQPKLEVEEGSPSAPMPKPLDAPYGFAKLGWLRTLKNSARNWAVRRSWNLNFLVTDKSQLRRPGSSQMLRPDVPKVPRPGGIKA